MKLFFDQLTIVLDRPDVQVFPLSNQNSQKYERFLWIDNKNKLWGGKIEFKINTAEQPYEHAQVIFSHLEPTNKTPQEFNQFSKGWWLAVNAKNIQVQMGATHDDGQNYPDTWHPVSTNLAGLNPLHDNPNNISLYDGGWHKFQWFTGNVGDGERFYYSLDNNGWFAQQRLRIVPFNADAVWGVTPELARARVNYANFQGEVRNFKLYAEVPPTDILLNPPFIKDTPLEIKELDVSNFINLLDQYVSDRDWIQQALTRLRQELQEEIDLNNKLKELQPDETSFLVTKVQDFINQYGTELTDTENELQQIFTQLQQLITDNKLLMNSNKALKEQLIQLNSSGVDTKITNIRDLINKNIKLLQENNRWGDTTDKFYKFNK